MSWSVKWRSIINLIYDSFHRNIDNCFNIQSLHKNKDFIYKIYNISLNVRKILVITSYMRLLFIPSNLIFLLRRPVSYHNLHRVLFNFYTLLFPTINWHLFYSHRNLWPNFEDIWGSQRSVLHRFTDDSIFFSFRLILFLVFPKLRWIWCETVAEGLV